MNLETTAKSPCLLNFPVSFPILTKFAPVYDPTSANRIADTLRQVIASGQQSGRKNTNYFLVLLREMLERTTTPEFKDLGITETTVVAQAITMFAGGFEITSSTLTHLLLYMAENPEIEKKMYTELMEALARNQGKDGRKSDMASNEIDHKVVEDSAIPYIVACINETLRLAPTAYRSERVCNKDWSYKGISIKKGTVVTLPTWAANRNPQLFPDEPAKFKPERFLPEAKAQLNPYAFTSFGFGPRHCIGRRFAYENMKLFVCHFLKNFRVEKRTDTQMEYKPGTIVIIGFRPVYLDFVLRN